MWDFIYTLLATEFSKDDIIWSTIAMQSNTAPESTAAPMSKETRDLLIAGVQDIRVKIALGMKEKPRMAYAIRSELNKKKEELLIKYYAQLPHYVFGRCPFCNVELKQVFDPWGLDGFWWQENLSGKCPMPSACGHFRVLTGALNLNGQPPQGGEEESHPGPEVPYVIPKALELPTMVAVISSIAMKNGYTAYPISYFSSEKPSVTALANPWRMTSCNFFADDGRPAFTYKTDPWDFELQPWIEKSKVKWIEPNDDQNILKSAPDKCPYVELPGLQQQQTIKNDKRHTTPPPNNETMDPFSG